MVVAFIARQPNGLLCRFSTVTYTVTHYDMTDEEYIEMCAEKARQEAKGVLENHLGPLSSVIDMTDEEYIEIRTEEARKMARDILKGSLEPFNSVREYLMSRERFEELLQEMSDKSSKTRKELSSITKGCIDMLGKMYEVANAIVQEMADKDNKIQNYVVKFCNHCKYYKLDKNTYICTNEKSENFNINTAPFQHCSCFFKKNGD